MTVERVPGARYRLEDQPPNRTVTLRRLVAERIPCPEPSLDDLYGALADRGVVWGVLEDAVERLLPRRRSTSRSPAASRPCAPRTRPCSCTRSTRAARERFVRAGRAARAGHVRAPGRRRYDRHRPHDRRRRAAARRAAGGRRRDRRVGRSHRRHARRPRAHRRRRRHRHGLPRPHRRRPRVERRAVQPGLDRGHRLRRGRPACARSAPSWSATPCAARPSRPATRSRIARPGVRLDPARSATPHAAMLALHALTAPLARDVGRVQHGMGQLIAATRATGRDLPPLRMLAMVLERVAPELEQKIKGALAEADRDRGSVPYEVLSALRAAQEDLEAVRRRPAADDAARRRRRGVRPRDRPAGRADRRGAGVHRVAAPEVHRRHGRHDGRHRQGHHRVVAARARPPRARERGRDHARRPAGAGRHGRRCTSWRRAPAPA